VLDGGGAHWPKRHRIVKFATARKHLINEWQEHLANVQLTFPDSAARLAEFKPERFVDTFSVVGGKQTEDEHAWLGARSWLALLLLARSFGGAVQAAIRSSKPLIFLAPLPKRELDWVTKHLINELVFGFAVMADVSLRRRSRAAFSALRA